MTPSIQVNVVVVVELHMSERVFEIHVKGELSMRLCESFDDAEVTVEHGVTRLRVPCSDASALHGIIERIETLGLELLDVRPSGDTLAT